MHYAPREELEQRIGRLQATLVEHQLEAALLHGVTSLLYFAGTAQQAHLLVPASGPPTLLVRRVLERARADSALERLVPLPSLRGLVEHLGGATRLGMELDILPVTHLERYRKAVPGLQPVDVGGLTRELRSVKSAYEVDKVRAAARAADATLREVTAALREGVSELELSIVAEGAERRHGFQGMLRWRAATGFECPWVHVLAGDSGLAFSFADTPYGGEGVTPAAPYGAGHRRVRQGVPVTVDFALARDGYIHDSTRTMVLGEPPRQVVEAHDACRRILDGFRAAARPGVTGEALWEDAVRHAEAAGLDRCFMGHGEQRVQFVGHGVGLELDELPVLAPRQRQPLQQGNVIAVEPKFFFPGLGAVGLEDTFLVQDDGVETLTVTPDELIVVPCP